MVSLFVLTFEPFPDKHSPVLLRSWQHTMHDDPGKGSDYFYSKYGNCFTFKKQGVKKHSSISFSLSGI
jgi:hypothetical protein